MVSICQCRSFCFRSCSLISSCCCFSWSNCFQNSWPFSVTIIRINYIKREWCHIDELHIGWHIPPERAIYTFNWRWQSHLKDTWLTRVRGASELNWPFQRCMTMELHPESKCSIRSGDSSMIGMSTHPLGGLRKCLHGRIPIFMKQHRMVTLLGSTSIVGTEVI